MLAPDLALAGTTGGLTGTVVDQATGKPVAGATVTATSPSQTVSQTTDASGHYSFLSLAPDTYTISVQEPGYQAASQQGVTIAADTTASAALQISKQLRTIGRVAARSQGSLVRSGTTADVYNVSAAQQRVVAAAGGGATQDSAFSALSTVPGVAVAPGQAGYIGAAATLSIRGGDYDQIGYQFDGIPINRSFDNYPSGQTSSLGQQELQVYTGAPPPGTLSEGISGYINQVIKTGTNPGFVSADVAIGTPYYHKAAFEAGGTALNNRFSYYVGVGGFNQAQRYVDNFDGASLSNSYGFPVYGSLAYTGVPTCSLGVSQAVAPSCYVNGKLAPQGNILGPFNSFDQSLVADRDTVVNLHYYFPHKDGTRDDIQALFDNSTLFTQDYSSTNDLGGVGFAQNANVAIGGTFAGNTNVNPNNLGFLTNGKPNTVTYIDGYQLGLPTGGFLPTNYRQYASVYSFPNSQPHTFDDQVNPAIRDGFNNDQSIEKLQFTKSLGSNAFFRVYGYGFYSDWLNTGTNSAYLPAGEVNGDYELESHARGTGFSFQDQINPQNLVSFGGDYSTASVLRDNNTEYVNGEYGPNSVNARTAIGVLVNSANPTNGVCYTPAGVATACYASATGFNAYAAPTANSAGNPTGAQFATLQQAYNGTVAPITAANCGGGACQYLLIGNGLYSTYNTVTPNFYGLSINDEIKPIDKLTVNLGLRLDDYQFIGGSTQGTAARTFLYNAYNADECENTTTQLITAKATLGLAPGTSCAGTAGYANVNFTNPANQSAAFPVFQPRAGFTYSVTPRTVLRFAYGRYAEPPNTAFEQYNTLQSGAAATLYGTYGFQQFGYTTPFHSVVPSTSNNYDFSIEQALPGQVSFKISPFIRKTQNQYQQFFLNKETNFVSGLPVGNQTSQGVEFELDKGNFANEGLSAKLSFAYTNSYIKYNTLSNGSTVLTPVVNAINAYNALTRAGGGARCYTLQNAAGTGGLADPTCAAGSIANPYYNAPEENANAFNSSVNYVPYDTIPAAQGVSAVQYGYPYVASLVLSEKIKRFSISPIVQFFAGQRYGSPLATMGIDPTTCTGALASAANGDPRYTFGSSGGLGYNANDCAQLGGGIPNVQSGAFDGLGAYVEPSQLLLNAQVAYEFNKNVGLTVNVANIVNTCFGGSKVPWAVKGSCGYALDQAGAAAGIGNTYNPGDPIQPSLQYSYDPYWLQQPLGIYGALNFKL